LVEDKQLVKHPCESSNDIPKIVQNSRRLANVYHIKQGKNTTLTIQQLMEKIKERRKFISDE
jgi:hypothetical protein